METKIYQKLSLIQGTRVKKGAENPFFKSKYATLDSIVEILMPLLKEHGLLIYHGTIQREVVTRVIDVESGESIQSSFPLPTLEDPQKIGSAITYARRYNIVQLFNLVTDDDDDGNACASDPKQCVHQWTEFSGISKKNGKPYKAKKCKECSTVEFINN
tara:strand:- start:3282 stop:3758 length:477 start_codon:yes stop_codon:yes gene_type:complete